MKPSDIFGMTMMYLIIFISGGDPIYIVVGCALARIGYVRLVEEEAKPDGLFSVKPEKDPLEEEMRDGVKEE
jgi:phosphomannomutase